MGYENFGGFREVKKEVKEVHELTDEELEREFKESTKKFLDRTVEAVKQGIINDPEEVKAYEEYKKLEDERNKRSSGK